MDKEKIWWIWTVLILMLIGLVSAYWNVNSGNIVPDTSDYGLNVSTEIYTPIKNCLMVGTDENNKIICINATYAEAWNKSDAGFQTIILPAADVYEQVTNLELGNSSGFNLSNGNLTAQYSGIYLVNVQMSIELVAPSELGAQVFLNNVGQNNCYVHQHVATNNVESIGITCILKLVAGDKIGLKIDDHSNPPNNPTLDSFNMNIHRIG